MLVNEFKIEGEIYDMRVIFRKLRKTNFIIMCIVSMIIFLSVIVGNIESSNNSMIEVNNQLTENYREISFNDQLNQEEIITLLNKVAVEEEIIIKYYAQTGFNFDAYTEGVYFNGKFNYSYNILEGRFFEEVDFKSGNNVAVIGKEILEQVKYEDNKKYIFRGLEKYEVIGVIGDKDIASSYDNTVLYNLDSILSGKEFLRAMNWRIDSGVRTKEEIESMVNNIDTLGNIIIYEGMNVYPNPLKSAIKSNKNLIISFIAVIASVLITLIRCILYWMDSISLEIGVRKNYGASDRDVFIDIVKRYTIIAIISITLAVSIQYVMLKTKFIEIINYKINYIHIGFELGFLLVLGIIFIAISMYKINKTQINDLLRGE